MTPPLRCFIAQEGFPFFAEEQHEDSLKAVLKRLLKGGNPKMEGQNDIWNEMSRLEKRMDTLFGKFFGENRRDRGEMIEELSPGYRKAFTNFKETKNEFVIEIEIPGVEKEDIHLTTKEGGLEIRAEKRNEKEKGDKKDENYQYTKSYAGFYHFFDVPENADLENVDAKYKNGILILRLPKKEISEDKKIIDIK